jgi:hypothetical protein
MIVVGLVLNYLKVVALDVGFKYVGSYLVAVGALVAISGFSSIIERDAKSDEKIRKVAGFAANNTVSVMVVLLLFLIIYYNHYPLGMEVTALLSYILAVGVFVHMLFWHYCMRR